MAKDSGLRGDPAPNELDAVYQKPQAPQDRHGPKYDNDCDGWVRGMGKESPYPTFDRKNAWRGGKLRED